MKQQIALFYLVGRELYSSNSVVASPIVSSPGTFTTPNSHNGYGSKLSFLIAATILGSSVTLLLVAKWIYLSRQYRQTGNVSKKARFSSPPLWNANFSAPRQRTFPIFSEEYLGKKGNSGLLVGLFGSPSWETRYSNIIDAMSEQLSFTRITGTSSSPRCYSSHQYSNNSNGCAVNTFSEGSPAFVLPDRILQGLSCELPALPLALVLKDKLDGRPTQPSLCMTGGSTTTNRFSFDQSFINIPEAALLSPLTSVYSWSVASSHRSSQGTYFMKSLNKTPSSSCYDGLDLPNSSTPNFNALSSSEDMDDPTSEHESNRNPPPYDPSPFPQSLLGSPDDCFEHCVPRCNSTFTTGERTAGDNVADFPYSVRRSPDADEAITANCKYTDVIETAKIKSRTPPFQHAQMRSPKVGPSPLRSMFLPGNEESHGGAHNSNIELGSISPRSLLNTSDVDPLHEPDAYRSVAKLLTTRHGRKPHSKNFRHSTSSNARIRKNSDSEQIFGLIQELVHETKAWDDSLFVDHKFKAMIDGSNLTNYVSTNIRKKRRQSCRPPYPFYGLLEDIPEVEAETLTLADIRNEKPQTLVRNSQRVSGEELLAHQKLEYWHRALIIGSSFFRESYHSHKYTYVIPILFELEGLLPFSYPT